MFCKINNDTEKKIYALVRYSGKAKNFMLIMSEIKFSGSCYLQ